MYVRKMPKYISDRISELMSKSMSDIEQEHAIAEALGLCACGHREAQEPLAK